MNLRWVIIAVLFATASFSGKATTSAHAQRGNDPGSGWQPADPVPTPQQSAPAEIVEPGMTYSTNDADFSTPIPPTLDDPQWYGPDGGRRPLWRWLPPSNGRHRGIGQPLEGESWLTRPFQISPFSGAFVADDLLKGRVNGSTGFLTGFRMGWDVSHFWGIETRLGFTNWGLDSPNGNVQLGNAKAFLWDTGLMWYPLGDARLRPYATIGMGFADIRYYDEFATYNHPTIFTMPIGVGMKYRYSPRWAFRFDVLDVVSYDNGRQSDTMHNLVITAGIEGRLGFGPRQSYFPWNPARAWY